MTIMLIHKADGTLKPAISKNAPLSSIKLTAQEERDYLRPFKSHLDARNWDREDHKKAILTYHKRLAKLDCEEVVGLHFDNSWYVFRATVRYPDGEVREWVGTPSHYNDPVWKTRRRARGGR